jgi:hypothetical protein
MVELKALAIEGPDLEKHDVVCWRCLDLREEVARQFTVEVHADLAEPLDDNSQKSTVIQK